MSNNNIYKQKYLLYKNKYLKLKTQLGGGHVVKVYDKSNSTFKFNVELEPDDDIYSFKNQVKSNLNDNSINIDNIDVYSYRSNICTGIVKTVVDESDMNLCYEIKNEPIKSNIPKQLKTGYETIDIPLTDFIGKINLPEFYFDGNIKSGKQYYDGWLDIYEGYGIIKRNNLTMIGSFKNNTLVGFGKALYKDDEHEDLSIGIFENGYLVNGIFERKGKYKDIGSFKEDQLNGLGRREYQDGTIIEGLFEYGTLIKGEKKYPDGEVHNGVYVGNSLSEGSIKYSDDIIKIKKGKFVNNEIVEGVIFKTNGYVKKGFFVDDELYGEGIAWKIEDILSQNDLNKGNFTEGHVLKGIFNEGRVIVGESSTGQFIGWNLVKGIKYVCLEGGGVETYKGTFVNGKLEGEGKFTDIDGNFVSGIFTKGEIIEDTSEYSDDNASKYSDDDASEYSDDDDVSKYSDDDDDYY
jgi:hypothetical protein